MSDPCPIHQADEALAWCITEGVTINTYGSVIRVTHRRTRKSVVWMAREGADGFSLPGHFMMACRSLWAQVNKAVTA